MSAECSVCSTDLVGYMDTAYCPVCELDKARLEILQLKATAADLERRMYDQAQLYWRKHHAYELSEARAVELERRVEDWKDTANRHLNCIHELGPIICDSESRLARLNEARAMAEALVISHEGHIASLEEEKAQAVESVMAQERPIQAALINERDTLKIRLAQAETREATLRSVLELCKAPLDEVGILTVTEAQRIIYREVVAYYEGLSGVYSTVAQEPPHDGE